MTKAKKLRQLLADPKKTIVITGAHNGLSAKLVEEAGFDGVWASGFEIATSHAVPDANILTMDDTLRAAKDMNDAVGIPVVADCDNGFGNAINVIRTVQEFERAGIAAICIEDNQFPKRCSFYSGVKRELESVEEFAGKIRAATQARKDPDFVVIARTEAVIAGWGVDEALTRANAYADAGADMVVIHSKSPDPGEIAEFARRWQRPVPLIAIPTIYKDTSVDDLSKMGFKLVIFANHAIRSSIKAMRETLATLRQSNVAASVEDRVVPLTDVYQVVSLSIMKEQEAAFLPKAPPPTKALILAAGAPHHGLEQEGTPVCLLDVKGKTILDRQRELFASMGISSLALVRGYGADRIAVPGMRTYDNAAYATTLNAASLLVAAQELDGPIVISYGDVIFNREILQQMLERRADVTVAVDHSWRERYAANQEVRPGTELVVTERTPAITNGYLVDIDRNRVTAIGAGVDPAKANAEFIGLVRCSERGAKLLAEVCRDLQARDAKAFAALRFADVLAELLVRTIAVETLDVSKGWIDVDTLLDYRAAQKEIC